MKHRQRTPWTSGASGLPGRLRRITLPFAESPYTAELSSQWTIYAVSAGAGADFLFTLPPATGSGEVAVIKKMDANAHNVVVGPDGADTIDGVNSAVNSTITIQNDTIKLVDFAAGVWLLFA